MSNQNWVSQIKNHRKKVYSQCGEEGFIEFILQNIGVDLRRMQLREFGCGDGVSLSNSKYFIDNGCGGCGRYDGNTNNGVDTIQKWLTSETVSEIGAMDNQFGIDLFLIDVDGNDYHFLDAYLKELDGVSKPKLIVCEINPIWKRNEAAIIPYNENHVWNNDDYYGMSLKAAELLLENYGYKLVFVNDSLNAYFVLSDLLPSEFTTDYDYKVKKDHPHNKLGIWRNEKGETTTY